MLTRAVSRPAGDVEDERLDAARLDAAFAVVARQVADGQVPSAVLAVADADGIIRADAWSGRDRTTIEAIYLLASITKPIVATAVMQLVERGLLVLSTPIKRYLPEFEPSSGSLDATGHEPITAQHLLTHTSGMIDIDEDLLSRERPDRARLFEIACTAPLRFASHVGLLLTGASALLVLYIVIGWLMGNAVQGWTSLMLVVVVLGAVQMFVLGMIGEYLGRLYVESKRRPLYLIADVAGPAQGHASLGYRYADSGEVSVSPQVLRPESD